MPRGCAIFGFQSRKEYATPREGVASPDPTNARDPATLPGALQDVLATFEWRAEFGVPGAPRAIPQLAPIPGRPSPPRPAARSALKGVARTSLCQVSDMSGSKIQVSNLFRVPELIQRKQCFRSWVANNRAPKIKKEVFGHKGEDES